MYTIFYNSNVDLCKEVCKIDTHQIFLSRILDKIFLFLDSFISNNFVHIGKAKVSKFSTLFKSKLFLKLNKRLLFYALSFVK